MKVLKNIFNCTIDVFNRNQQNQMRILHDLAAPLLRVYSHLAKIL